MIQWCAYCQSFIGEKAPFEDYTFTHGICASCNANKETSMSRENVSVSVGLRKKFDNLRDAVKKNDFEKVHRVMDELLATGISPVDLTMAFFQPVLFQVGEQWESGATSVNEEHRYTAYFENLLNQLWLRRPEVSAKRFSDSPTTYLCNAAGSQHTLGLKVLEFVLSFLDIPNFVEPNTNDIDAVVEQINKLKPKVVGVSISLENQVSFAETLATRILIQSPTIKLVTGGSYFREKSGPRAIPNGYKLIKDFSQIRELFG